MSNDLFVQSAKMKRPIVPGAPHSDDYSIAVAVSIASMFTRETSGEVLPDEDSRSAPVDVYGLARALGLEINDVELGEDISGKIEKSWRSGYLISVNARHPLTRRRFTAAHEIAHFVLPQGFDRRWHC